MVLSRTTFFLQIPPPRKKSTVILARFFLLPEHLFKGFFFHFTNSVRGSWLAQFCATNTKKNPAAPFVGVYSQYPHDPDASRFTVLVHNGFIGALRHYGLFLFAWASTFAIDLAQHFFSANPPPDASVMVGSHRIVLFSVFSSLHGAFHFGLALSCFGLLNLGILSHMKPRFSIAPCLHAHGTGFLVDDGIILHSETRRPHHSISTYLHNPSWVHGRHSPPPKKGLGYYETLCIAFSGLHGDFLSRIVFVSFFVLVWHFFAWYAECFWYSCCFWRNPFVEKQFFSFFSFLVS